MPNELDMDAYHQEGIDPGEHKVFNITPTIHSFNERFQGEPPVTAGPGLEGYDPNKMPDWWVKALMPTRKDWPDDRNAVRPLTNRGVDRSYEEPFDLYTGQENFNPISDKQIPFAPYTSKSIEDIATKHKVEAGQIKDILKDLNEHPENMIGTGELGITAKSLSMLGNTNRRIFEHIYTDEAAQQLKSLRESGKSLEQISNEMNAPRNAIIYRLRQLGLIGEKIPKEERVAAVNERDSKLLDMADQGMSYGDIAKALNISRGSVAGKIDRLRQRTGIIPKRESSYEPIETSSPRKNPTLPKLNLPENVGQPDPEYDKALSDWMKNQFE